MFLENIDFNSKNVFSQAYTPAQAQYLLEMLIVSKKQRSTQECFICYENFVLLHKGINYSTKEVYSYAYTSL